MTRVRQTLCRHVTLAFKDDVNTVEYPIINITSTVLLFNFYMVDFLYCFVWKELADLFTLSKCIIIIYEQFENTKGVTQTIQ
jgi:hypothetical protein